MQEAIERAIDRCIDESVLAEFLKKNRWENMNGKYVIGGNTPPSLECLTPIVWGWKRVIHLDYTFERQLALERAEAWEIGYEQGKILGALERFGPIPKALEDLIDAQEDLRMLKKWRDLSLGINSIEAFVTAINESMEKAEEIVQ